MRNFLKFIYYSVFCAVFSLGMHQNLLCVLDKDKKIDQVSGLNPVSEHKHSSHHHSHGHSSHHHHHSSHRHLNYHSSSTAKSLIHEHDKKIEKDDKNKLEKVAVKQSQAVTPEIVPQKIETSEKSVFIFNSYTERRGDPKMLAIHCAQCKAFVMDYQKDGPGRLLRCYLDRIHRPYALKMLQYKKFSISTSPKLHCPTCKKVIGIPMIYKMEQRPAYKMLFGKFYF